MQYKEAKELPNVGTYQHLTDKLKDYDIYAIVGKREFIQPLDKLRAYHL